MTDRQGPTGVVPRQRDTRLDVFRALALLTIFVNHVPGQYLEHLTHKNFGFSDSAEAFVLISGMSVGLAYGSRFAIGERLAVTLRILRRALTLYVAHIMMSVITFAIFAGGALWFSRPDLLSEINLRAVVDRTEQGVVSMVLLGHQFGYNNILSMYAVVFLMLPGFLWLYQRSAYLLLAVSGTLWLCAGIWQIAPSNFLDDGYWFLNPLSWQFLFVIGFVGVLRVKKKGFSRNPVMMALSATYLAVSFVWVVFSWWNIDFSYGLPAVLTGFDKTFLSTTRLLHVLAGAYLLAVIPALSNWAALPLSHPLVAVGRHSLAVFIFGTILAMVGQVMMFVTGKNPILGTLYAIVGIALHFAYARYLDWQAAVIAQNAKRQGLKALPVKSDTPKR
ncbi:MULTISPECIES: OpgC family protein [unclassified Shinella]|uniref:OpgC family protein n=1 Tax=unclassified Shinella TaxID=2643062 RepID=UPI00234E8B4C|nr:MULTISPECIES: OpgC domain-containing protein [unclassified Shinella]MCO5154962.1 OpgC domain-containing protein [Shinella sp.]MDC7263906.1 OpgC domain-containing protein [Shinella sp. HY16]MDC7270802.1 OpgC domain-containing protein [Shinella sp. YZ44]